MLTNINTGGCHKENRVSRRNERIHDIACSDVAVSYFGLGFDSSDTFNLQQYVFVPLRMPLFFFVSGFLMYKAAFQWNYSNTAQFLKKKVLVQVISPLIFMVAMSLIKGSDIVSALYDPRKGGYWFTFALFEYFLIYIFCQQMIGI